MSVKKSVTVTNRQQLVDLNGEMTNFDLTFTATSRNNESFEILVVDQTTLDNNPNLEYKRANGTISGNIVSDKNLYQNYFLCIKAEQPCEVDIVIDKKEIAPKTESTSLPGTNPNMSSNKVLPHATTPQRPEGTNWKMVIIVGLVLGGSVLLYFMYMKKKESSTSPAGSEIKASPVASSTQSSPSPSVPANNYGFKKPNESLIARLNSIPMK